MWVFVCVCVFLCVCVCVCVCVCMCVCVCVDVWMWIYRLLFYQHELCKYIIDSLLLYTRLSSTNGYSPRWQDTEQQSVVVDEGVEVCVRWRGCGRSTLGMASTSNRDYVYPVFSFCVHTYSHTHWDRRDVWYCFISLTYAQQCIYLLCNSRTLITDWELYNYIYIDI